MKSDDELVIQPHRPSFSVIIPTWGEPDKLLCTLNSLVVQSQPAVDYELEILVIGDGFEQKVKAIIDNLQEQLRKSVFKVYLYYYALREHTGSGNIPRAEGLKKASREWVIFMDTGGAATYRLFETLCGAINGYPDGWLYNWDMLQLLQPVPIMTSVYALKTQSRDQGLPYIIPGMAVAVRRDWAQQVEWPNEKASDWVYFSKLWETMFGTPEFERKDDVNKHVVLIPSTLTVAYAFAPPRIRWPMGKEAYIEHGFDKGFDNASNISDSFPIQTT